MAYEQKDNSGSAFLNDKRPGKQDADYRGSCKIDGKDYWISMWKKDKDGKPWVSLSFNPKVESKNKPVEDYRGNGGGSDFDSEIPF